MPQVRGAEVGTLLNILPVPADRRRAMGAVCRHAATEPLLLDNAFTQKLLTYCIKQDNNNKAQGMAAVLLPAAQTRLTGGG